jgi:hypothetical protein
MQWTRSGVDTQDREREPFMSKEKKPATEQSFPKAPTDLMDEVAAHLSDLQYFYPRQSIEELSEIGVTVGWSKENGGYTFAAKDRTLRKIAEEAYSLGFCVGQMPGSKSELDELSSRLKGNKKSVKIRQSKALQRKDQVLVEYAKRAQRGDVSRREFAADIGEPPSFVSKIIKEFNELCDGAKLSLSDKARSKLSHEELVSWVVDSLKGKTVGVNESTVRAALQPKRKRKRKR